MIADGTKIQASGMRTIEITMDEGSITLMDIWHVPLIGGSLMSVSRMLDAGYTVEFGYTKCIVRKAGVQTNLRSRVGSLYHLNQTSAHTHQQRFNVVHLGLAINQSARRSIETWHRRLCHRSLDENLIQYIACTVEKLEEQRERQPTSAICGVCAIGCQQKESSTKTREKAKQILQVVHSALCGLMQPPGLNGEKYFVIFIHEMSGHVSVALLQSKDRALTAFKFYRARAE